MGPLEQKEIKLGPSRDQASTTSPVPGFSLTHATSGATDFLKKRPGAKTAMTEPLWL